MYARTIGSSTSYGGRESVSFCPGRNSADGGFVSVSSGITSRSRFTHRLSSYTSVLYTSPITASAPTISPYSVQYPQAISLLLPVVSTSAPVLFDSAINKLPRILGCRFSSASPKLVPLKNGSRDFENPPYTPRIGTVEKTIPKFRASFSASVTDPVEENSLGIPMPCTFSAPSASTAIAATSAESIPPLSPTIAFLNPHLLR